MTTVVQDWGSTLQVRFDGEIVEAPNVRTSHGVEQPVGIATIDVPLSALDAIADGAEVTIDSPLDGARLFTGIFRSPDRNASVSGAIATLMCEGPNYRMTYPLEKDVVFTGGARQTPANISDHSRHVGNTTIAWYSRPVPEALTVDLIETPTTDSTFVWVRGKVHGSNSYPTTLGDMKIKRWSRVELWQAGEKIGYANLPVSQENYDQELPYGEDADDPNWDDFEVFIAVTVDQIRVDDGDLAFRFISGTKPGSSERDEYEIMRTYWQTAGRNSVREIIRGMKARSGFASGEYLVNEVTRLSGGTVQLGGNGLVDAGQVRVSATEQPINFVNRIAGLFGYYDFDCPDGITRCQAVRGIPTGPSAAVFVEGQNILSIRRTIDPRNAANKVEVKGASGTDQNRNRFAYTSVTADEDILPSAAIPDPPGVSLLPISDSLLVNFPLCRYVREIAEINHAESAVYLEWRSWPQGLRPGQIVEVNSPSAKFSGKVWLMRVDNDLGVSGCTCTLVGWAGGIAPFDGDDEAADPDPAETPILPTDPRPVDEWRAMRPGAGVNDG